MELEPRGVGTFAEKMLVVVVCVKLLRLLTPQKHVNNSVITRSSLYVLLVYILLYLICRV